MRHEINIENLENLVLKRFWSLEELENMVDELIGSEGTIVEQSWKNDSPEEYELSHDYLIVGTIFNEEETLNGDIERVEQYDIDIYYAKSRNHCVVTEVHYQEV